MNFKLLYKLNMKKNILYIFDKVLCAFKVAQIRLGLLLSHGSPRLLAFFFLVELCHKIKKVFSKFCCILCQNKEVISIYNINFFFRESEEYSMVYNVLIICFFIFVLYKLKVIIIFFIVKIAIFIAKILIKIAKFFNVINIIIYIIIRVKEKFKNRYSKLSFRYLKKSYRKIQRSLDSLVERYRKKKK